MSNHCTPHALAAVWGARESGHYILMLDGDITGHVVEAPDKSFISFARAANPLACHRTLSEAQELARHFDRIIRNAPADAPCFLPIAGTVAVPILVLGAVLMRFVS